MKDPRILVISRPARQPYWRDLLGDMAIYATVGAALYGIRVDLIIVDLPMEDRLTPRFQEWSAYVVECRKSSHGKVIWA